MPDDVPADDLTPHLQWATDPAGRRYWIQGGPCFGGDLWTDAIRPFFTRKERPPQVQGIVLVTRVEGDQETQVFESLCSTLDEARFKASSLAEEIQGGTFREQPPRSE